MWEGFRLKKLKQKKKMDVTMRVNFEVKCYPILFIHSLHSTY